MKKLLLCVDMDETILMAEDVFISALDRIEPHEMTQDGYDIYYRPNVKEFFDKIDQDDRIEYGIFTAAGEDYAKDTIERLLMNLNIKKQPVFFLTSEDCKSREPAISPYGSYGNNRRVTKDLTKTFKSGKGYGKHNVLAIDDKFVYTGCQGNHLKVKPYEGRKVDDELLRVIDVIDTVLKYDSVRDCLAHGDIREDLPEPKKVKAKKHDTFSP